MTYQSRIQETNEDYVLEKDIVTSVRVLLVEDNRAEATLVRQMLRGKMGNDTVYVSSVPRLKDAISMMECEVFDLIILDLNLLDANGMTGLIWLTSYLSSAVPVIVYSAGLDRHAQDEAIMLGATYCLSKEHTDIFTLKSIVQKTLAQPRH